MEYNKIFRPETLSKLNKKSAENLKSMLGNKSLMQTMIQSQQLLDDISKAEAPYKDQLEELAKEMVEKMYPIIEEEGIRLDAKIVPMGEINSTLDEIKVNNPNEKQEVEDAIKRVQDKKGWNREEALDFIRVTAPKPIRQLLKKYYPVKLQEQISPESRRRIINSVTQGAALRGAFSFYLFKDYLDAIDPSLIDKYNQIMKNSFGIYDDDNAIAMLLSALAQGQKAAGGSSKVIMNEIKVNNPNDKSSQDIVDIIYDNKFKNLNNILIPAGVDILHMFSKDNYDLMSQNDKNKLYQDLKQNIIQPINEQQDSNITIQARALNFPMLVHELIKGLYELVSLQGFKGDKEANQGVVDKVDKLEHEPHDIKYGKLIYDALNDIFAESPYSDPRIREFFFSEVYQLEDEEFLEFVENAINEDLSKQQISWVNQTLKEISMDLKQDDASQYID